MLKTYIEANLASGFIRLSKPSANTSILFVQKKNGSFCLCINYQRLNSLIIKNCYSLPLIGEPLNCLDRAKRFTQLNMTNTYHQMRIRVGDEWRPAFWTRYGYFEYQVIAFSFSNTSISFQGYVNKILVEKLDVFIIMYLDNILIYTKDAGQGDVKAI